MNHETSLETLIECLEQYGAGSKWGDGTQTWHVKSTIREAAKRLARPSPPIGLPTVGVSELTPETMAWLKRMAKAETLEGWEATFAAKEILAALALSQAVPGERSEATVSICSAHQRYDPTCPQCNVRLPVFNPDLAGPELTSDGGSKQTSALRAAKVLAAIDAIDEGRDPLAAIFGIRSDPPATATQSESLAEGKLPATTPVLQRGEKTVAPQIPVADAATRGREWKIFVHPHDGMITRCWHGPDCKQCVHVIEVLPHPERGEKAGVAKTGLAVPNGETRYDAVLALIKEMIEDFRLEGDFAADREANYWATRLTETLCTAERAGAQEGEKSETELREMLEFKKDVIRGLEREQEALLRGCAAIGHWMSAALDDESVCDDMKQDIHIFLAAVHVHHSDLMS